LEPARAEGDSKAPQLVVIGLGRLGEALVAQAARTWWLNRDDRSFQLRLTLVDKAAETKRKALELRYPRLNDACEIHTCPLEVPSPDLLAATHVFTPPNNHEKKVVVVCLEDDNVALSMALDLARRLSHSDIPIVVNLMEKSGLMGLLDQAEDERSYSNLWTFNVLDETCTPDLVLGGTNEILARAIHENYVRQQQAQGHTPQTNPSLVPWEKLREDFQEDNRRAADSIAQKFAAIGCTITIMEDWDAEFSLSPHEVEKLAEMEHERWMADKLRAGWCFAPGLKDAERKTNPCLVPWEKLPEEEKEKDREQVRSLPSFLKNEGFQIIRLAPSPQS
jgi:hypothetical protein